VVSGSAWHRCGITSQGVSDALTPMLARCSICWPIGGMPRAECAALVLKRDLNTLASFAVFQRCQASGEQLTVQLARDVIAETGSDANAVAAFYQAREWLRDCENTKRLGRR
jgi:hypothetical protein